MALNRVIKASSALLAAVTATSSIAARAEDDPGAKISIEMRQQFDESIRGKTVAYLPIATGVPAMDEWGRVLRTEAEARGMKVVVRDPNNNPTNMVQALTALINDKPDVLVVQNPSLTLLAKELRKAEGAGIHVVQLNMNSNYRSSAYVGVDWREVGRMLGKEIVKECGAGSGKSGKVQIIQGEATSAGSIDQMAGIDEVAGQDKTLQIVSNQAAMWDANNAMNIATTVLQQNPDLCGIVGFWGVMTSGASQAIKNAGKSGQVTIIASGEGSQIDCDLVNSGALTKELVYSATVQGHDIVAAVETVLQDGQKPGTAHVSFYTRPVWLDKNAATPGACFALPKK